MFLLQYIYQIPSYLPSFTTAVNYVNSLNRLRITQIGKEAFSYLSTFYQLVKREMVKIQSSEWVLNWTPKKRHYTIIQQSLTEEQKKQNEANTAFRVGMLALLLLPVPKLILGSNLGYILSDVIGAIGYGSMADYSFITPEENVFSSERHRKFTVIGHLSTTSSYVLGIFACLARPAAAPLLLCSASALYYASIGALVITYGIQFYDHRHQYALNIQLTAKKVYDFFVRKKENTEELLNLAADTSDQPAKKKVRRTLIDELT